MLTESSAEVAVNERDEGWVIVIGVDVANFADTQDTRPRGEEGCSPVEVLVTFVDKHGYYMQTEQIGEEIR